jgi:hypothetical protein
MKHSILFGLALILMQGFLILCSVPSKNQPDLSSAVILVSPSVPSPMKTAAPQVLAEEVAKRTSLQLKISDNRDSKPLSLWYSQPIKK